jgi:protein tyrosine/serine phosphatase
MSSERDLSARDVEELLSILSKAEAPILIHCKNGADRSGLVSALYVAGVAGGSEFFAEFQLTPIYGHLPIFLLAAFAMDRSFEMVEPRLGFPDS